MKRVVLTLVVAGVAACADTTPLAPAPAAAVAATPKAGAPAVDSPALEDAIERLAASLGDGPDAAAARAALRQILVQHGTAAEQRATEALEPALDRLAAAQPELAAEIDAIRLAVEADAADRQHKPI